MTDETAAIPTSTTLPEALSRYAISLPPEQVEVLDRYCKLLWDWNTKLNLTRHTDYDKFVTRDVVDSLELSKCIQPEEDVLDVGTGGGVPGVILAVTRPDVSVSLCESVAKRAKVAEAIVRELGISCAVLHGRGEQLLGEGHTFDTLLFRAVARMEKILRWFEPHWGAMRRMLLVKGPSWLEERKASRERGLLARLDLRKLATYTTPGTGAENVILQISPKRG
ncbi:MAG: 16S rRNA (guanine(527)-N(7))-methyltransferase RsmG [Planctomycetia bacterium]|nr:16S rRNA (guanine(527)-N(7))-methyltransferase RsmG [Planctomycetia bacterium]